MATSEESQQGTLIHGNNIAHTAQVWIDGHIWGESHQGTLIHGNTIVHTAQVWIDGHIWGESHLGTLIHGNTIVHTAQVWIDGHIWGESHLGTWKYHSSHSPSLNWWPHLRPSLQSICWCLVSWQSVPLFLRYSKFHIQSWKFFWSKVHNWNVNCAWATKFIFDTRMDALVKVSKFLRQKISRPEGDSNPQPSDSCRML